MAEQIKVSDFVFDYLAERGVRHVFMIAGGGNMHLVDSLGKNPNLRFIPTHHEQAAAYAAEAYARVSENLGVCLVTTGPGAANAITGILAAWLDSIPVLCLSGQMKREVLVGNTSLRQLGDQEANIIPIVKTITKYAVMVDNPEDIRYHLEKAIYLAKSGRPGPVWLDVPLDVQGAKVDSAALRSFPEEERQAAAVSIGQEKLRKQAAEVIKRIKQAERPVLLAGNGIRLAGGVEILQKVIQKARIPVLGSFSGLDLVDGENPYFFGRPSSFGERAPNFILQNSDLLVSVGCRLNLRIVTFTWQAFARAAFKVVVDIDPAELTKKTISPDIAIQADAKEFLRELLRQLPPEGLPEKTKWLEYCRRVTEKYPAVREEHKNKKNYASAYHFVDHLAKFLGSDAVMAMGDGMACVIPHKVFKAKYGQRLIFNSGCAAMGYDLPAAVGACLASGRSTVCLAGDGSIMLNLQELQTIVHHNLPIKIFILLNDGYLSIRMTQDSFFGGHRVGSDSASGVSCPDFLKVGKAFGLATENISANEQVAEKIKKVLQQPGPVLCTVNLDPAELMLPKLSSAAKPDGRIISKPLEDLYPFLPREEFKANMLIEPWPEE